MNTVAKLEGSTRVHGSRITICDHHSPSKLGLSSIEQRPMLASHTLMPTLHTKVSIWIAEGLLQEIIKPWHIVLCPVNWILGKECVRLQISLPLFPTEKHSPSTLLGHAIQTKELIKRYSNRDILIKGVKVTKFLLNWSTGWKIGPVTYLDMAAHVNWQWRMSLCRQCVGLLNKQWEWVLRSVLCRWFFAL